jgi:sulfatase modifying factor 1
MKIQSLFTLAVTSALITSASATVTIDYVSVGNPGNAADLGTGSLYGAVAYAYQIGKYEVTNAQYGEFLNAKGASNSGAIYNSSMTGTGITQTGSSGNFSYSVTSGFENKPVVYVSWFDAARFANWMMNGQGSGDMETGAYTLNGATSGIITANIGAQVYLPSEDEWYKAAYYSAANTSYSLYPNGQNTITIADANYNFSLGSTTNVGTYSSDPSSYGTFDQGGNVWEWNDAVISGSSRGLRGGSFSNSEFFLRSSARGSLGPTDEFLNVGFRVASVPEPTSVLLTMFAGGLMLIRRKR